MHWGLFLNLDQVFYIIIKNMIRKMFPFLNEATNNNTYRNNGLMHDILHKPKIANN